MLTTGSGDTPRTAVRHKRPMPDSTRSLYHHPMADRSGQHGDASPDSRSILTSSTVGTGPDGASYPPMGGLQNPFVNPSVQSRSERVYVPRSVPQEDSLESLPGTVKAAPRKRGIPTIDTTTKRQKLISTARKIRQHLSPKLRKEKQVARAKTALGNPSL